MKQERYSEKTKIKKFFGSNKEQAYQICVEHDGKYIGCVSSNGKKWAVAFLTKKNGKYLHSDFKYETEHDAIKMLVELSSFWLDKS